MNTVLCVDDEKSVLSALRRLFLDEPWDVLYAEGGAPGLDLIEEHEVDLVLADFRMPGMDGVEFLRRVRERHPDCMRVVLSGYADIGTIVSALNEGQIYKFIAKPWNDEELLDTVRKLLEHQRVRRENDLLDARLRKTNSELTARVEEMTRAVEVAEAHARALAELVARAPAPLLVVDPAGTVVLASAGAHDALGRDPRGAPLAGLDVEIDGDLAGTRAARIAGREGVLAVSADAPPAAAPAR